MQRLSLDYTSPKEWIAEKLVLRDTDIVSLWNLGRAKAEERLQMSRTYKGEKSDFFLLHEKGFTLLIPYETKKLGLNELHDDTQTDSTESNQIELDTDTAELSTTM